MAVRIAVFPYDTHFDLEMLYFHAQNQKSCSEDRKTQYWLNKTHVPTSTLSSLPFIDKAEQHPHKINILRLSYSKFTVLQCFFD